MFCKLMYLHPPPLKATDICNIFTATRAKNKNSAPQTKRKTTRSRYKHKDIQETTKDIRQFVIVTKKEKKYQDKTANTNCKCPYRTFLQPR